MIITEKKKRGRKPKIDLLNNSRDNNTVNNLENNTENNTENSIINDPNITIEVENIKIPKKRGRKPKGGKIIENFKPIPITENIKPNIILHLKCNSEDLDLEINNTNIDTFSFSDMKANNLLYNYIEMN